MVKNIKKFFIMFICIPVLLFCGCTKLKTTCSEVNAVDYYYNSTIDCDLFELPSKTINISDITSSKLNKDLLDSYAKLTFTAQSEKIYHLYIEYICFSLYTNQTSEYDMDVNIEISNIVNVSDVNTVEPDDNTYTNTYSCIAKKNNSAEFKIYVNRIVPNATGSIMTIDILNSEIYSTDENTSFKWCIYNFKIYGESRAC